MKTNSKAARDAIKLHILECVYNSNGDNFLTYDDAVKHLYGEFDRVANYSVNMQKLPNNQERFMDYMQGLPFHFHFTYYGINCYLESIGLENNGKYSDEKSERLYYYLIYSEVTKAAQK